ncbi:MAG: hypothetical protein Q4F41_15040 [Eubacteriales bacterium]|nr:hypothetical protein [Eubacteriales bacterium]
MRKRLLHTCTLLLALAFLFLGSDTAHAATYEWKFDKDTLTLQWVNTATGKPVRSKFVKIKGYVYYFDANGNACTGWTEIKGSTYYFNSSGAMVTETWVNNRYLMKNGKMAKKRWVTDEDGLKVYVGADGVLIPNYKKNVTVGLKKNSKGTRFRQADGTYAKKQWVRWKGYWYYFYSNGYMAKKTFVGNHYVDKNGRMVTNKTVTIGKYKYKFDKDGEIIKKTKVKTTSK